MSLLFDNRVGGCCCKRIPFHPPMPPHPPIPPRPPWPIIGFIPGLILGALLAGLGLFLIVNLFIFIPVIILIALIILLVLVLIR